MANLTSVGVTSGVPSSGTGTVSTIDNLLTLGMPISGGVGSSANTASVTGAASSATSSMAGIVVSISPNSVNPNGTALSSASAPVTIASDQVAVAIKSTGVFTTTLSSNPTIILSSNVTIGSGSVSLVPTTSGGLTLFSVIISSGTNSTLISSIPRQVYKIECFNNSATIGYLHTYNLSSAPTAGSSLVFDRFLVPANTSGAGLITTTDVGVPYTTGLGYTFTGGIADTDTTAISSGLSYIVNIYYK